MNGRPAFDNFGQSYLAVIRLANRDYWEEIFHHIIISSGIPNALIPMLIIIYCSYYLVGIIWSQIAVSYKYFEIKRWEKDVIEEVNPSVSLLN